MKYRGRGCVLVRHFVFKLCHALKIYFLESMTLD